MDRNIEEVATSKKSANTVNTCKSGENRWNSAIA